MSELGGLWINQISRNNQYKLVAKEKANRYKYKLAYGL